MKIQNTPNLQLNNKNQSTPNKSKVAFKSAAGFTMFLSFLENNAAWGASAVDITCMGVPRTTVDFTRGPDAGLETARREFSSTAVDAAVGAIGLGAAWALARGINDKYGVKANKLLVSDDTLDILGETWNGHKESKNQLGEYLHKVLNSSKGFNPDGKGADENGYVKLSNAKKEIPSNLEKMAKALEEEITNTDKLSKETKNYLSALYMEETGAERNVKLELKDDKGKVIKKVVTSVDNFFNDIYKVTKTFTKDEVAATFKNGGLNENTFINSLKKLNRNTAIGGLAIATGLACSLQPINMYLTKKKTGKSGFVGVEGREPDHSVGFKMLKFGAAIAGCTAVMLTIAKKPLDVLKAVQFKGITPTVPQFKFVYGMTIVSRFLSARDKNELRESTIKDSLGFANWLILGGFVSKLTAMVVEKLPKFKNTGEKFIKHNQLENVTSKGKTIPKWISGSIVTRKEVLIEEFKKAGMMDKIIKNGKAISVKEMLKIAPKTAKTKIMYLNMIQIAGYVWSGAALGIGIPKLNIGITNSIEKKRKAKEAQGAIVNQ